MGQAKEKYIEIKKKNDEEKLAAFLGITYDELNETQWHQEPNESDDGFVFGYFVKFEKTSPNHILKKIKGLDANNQVYYSIDDIFLEEELDYIEQLEAIIENKFFYKSFQNEISNARQLNQIKLDNDILDSVLKRQLYITIIGALETFLSEAFINVTNKNPKFFRNFIETYPNFKERNFKLFEIYREYEKLQETAKKEMLEVIYHNLPKVRNMYTSTFKIEFPDITELSKAINTRHDLVHRNGKTKDAVDVVISKDEVSVLLNQVSTFVDEISNSLNLRKS